MTLKPAIIKTRGYPALTFGTWKLKGEECENLVKQSLDCGYSSIDTAELYNNEKEIGRAIRNHDRRDLFITTKVWVSNYSFEKIQSAGRCSLDRLGLDYLDLYLLHWPKKDTDYNAVLDGLKILSDSGLIHTLGLSNFNRAQLEEIIPLFQKRGLIIGANHIELHPKLFQYDLIDFCYRKGINVVGYSPLAGGCILDEPLLVRLAKKYKRDSAQIALNWVLSKSQGVVVNSKSADHLLKNMMAQEFKLSSDDYARIDGLENNLRLYKPSYGDLDFRSSP